MRSKGQNRYCTSMECLQTRVYLEVGETLVCNYCRKLLHKVTRNSGLDTTLETEI